MRSFLKIAGFLGILVAFSFLNAGSRFGVKKNQKHVAT